MTPNLIAAFVFIALTIWYVIFIYWVCEYLDTREKIMFSILGCLFGISISILLLC